MKTVDVTGLSCPEPVVRTLAALQGLPAGVSLLVVADTATARDNIRRTATSKGYRVTVAAAGQRYELTLTKP